MIGARCCAVRKETSPRDTEVFTAGDAVTALARRAAAALRRRHTYQ